MLMRSGGLPCLDVAFSAYLLTAQMKVQVSTHKLVGQIVLIDLLMVDTHIVVFLEADRDFL
jgi:hypothetical protein